MLNFRKKIFLFLTIIGLVVILASCGQNSDSIRVSLEDEEIEVRMQSVMEFKPVVRTSSSMSADDVELVYESSDESIVKYVNGTLYPQAEGQAQIKVYVKNNKGIFDRATVTVIKAELPELVYEQNVFFKNEVKPLSYELSYNYTGAVAAFEAINPEIADISAEGIVTAKAVGEARIKITVSDATEKYEEVVKVSVVESDFEIKAYELNGGAFVDEAPSAYNSLVELALPTPVKTGYEFAGWSDGVQVLTKIAVGTTGDFEVLNALWSVLTYGITYDYAGGVEVEGAPVTFTVEEEVALPTPTKAGYDFAGWTLDGAVVENIAKGTVGDVELVATWTPVKYAITYDYAGGEEVVDAVASYTIEEEVALPTPTKAGYDFAGWTLDGVVVENIAKGSMGDKALVATWKAVEYTITYDYAGGEELANAVKSYTIEEEVVFGAPKRANYYFLGWTIDGEIVEKIEKGSMGDKIVVATWEEIPSYAVSYDLAGGKWAKDYIQFGDELIALFNELGGSSTPTTKESFKATSHPQIKSVWNKAETLAEYKWLFEFALAEITAAATANNYTSEKYYTNTKELLEKMIAGDTTAVGGNYADGRTVFRWWLQILMTAKRSYTADIYEKMMTDYSDPVHMARFESVLNGVVTEVKPGEALPTPVREGYDFVGWYVDGVKVESVSADCTLVAEWTAVEYTISYDFAGGKWAKDYIQFGDELIALFNELGGSSTPTTKESFKATSHPQIKSVWNKAETLAEYKWLFEFALAEITAAATANNYTSEKYYTNTKELLEKMIAGDTTAVGGNYADGRTVFRWWLQILMTAKRSYTADIYEKMMTDYSDPVHMARFESVLNGVVNSYTVEDEVVLPTPARTDYNFLGWTIDGKLVDKINVGSVGDKVLVATWEFAYVKSAINYELSEGVLPEGVPTTYYEGLGLETLPVPTREGYNFAGWMMNGEVVTAISAEQIGEVTLTAQWKERVFSAITYELAEGVLPEGAATSYEEGVGLASLPVPTREGYNFAGWMMNGEVVTAISAEQIGEVTLTAQWKERVFSAITYELAEGVLPEGAATSYEEGIGLASLPVPTREGYSFQGWFMGENLVTSISADQSGDVVLTAQWVEIVEVYVGEGLDYATLDEAITSAREGSTIILSAGEYALSKVISKSFVIVGPNANLSVKDTRGEEAVINVAKDIAGNLAARSIVFNGVHIKGTGGGAGVPGVTFQDGGNMDTLTFRSCKISDTNTFIKFVNGASSVEILFENCYIHTIGQFILWSATGKMEKVTLVGNYVDGSTCGAVTNAAAALFRVRSGALEAYDNIFNGTSANTPGYFECSDKESVVKYNTFVNTMNFVKTDASNKLTFDENLYLDASGKALTSAPAALKGNGVTVDASVASSEEDRANGYANYLLTQNPDRYFLIEFDVNGGEFTSSYPTVYDSEAGIEMLPTVVREGFIFKGWYMNDELVESVPAGLSGSMSLVAKWEEPALYVDGQSGEGHFATLADAIAAAQPGEKIVLAAGTYAENVTIAKAGLRICGPNEGVNPNSGTRTAEAIYTGTITLAKGADGVTIDGIAFTGAARILGVDSVSYAGFTFQNNMVHDTDASSTAISGTSRYTSDAFIEFKQKSGGIPSNVEIANNRFERVDAINVLVNRLHNLSVYNNVFIDFGRDAVRVEGGYCDGEISFVGNHFEQTSTGKGYSGISLASVAGSAKTNILISDNTFKNLGKDLSAEGLVPFSGAISSHRFQEKPTSYVISNNIFDHCYNYISLRNNGATASTFEATIENNQFLGLPHDFYHNSYIGSDSSTTNPHLAIFNANYYEDNDGNVISDLSKYADLFKHVASYGTALTAKPGESDVEVLEFYSISYELNGGTTNDSFVTIYNSYNDAPIALPTLTKPNHIFNGWSLNGVLVTEIPADSRGDLVLTAEFIVMEGEVYTIEFVENKANVIWPSRGANTREEIVNALYADLYEWAQGNGETKSYAEYKSYIDGQLAAYKDIKLRNTSLGNYPAEDGSTEYFLNVPKYYQKWREFFVVFNTAMLAVNADQNFYTDTYATMVRLNQFVTWSTTGQGYFGSYIAKMCAATKIPQEIPTEYRGGQVIALPQISLANGLQFLGWYDNPEFTGSPVTSIKSTDSGNKKFYAKWEDEILPEKITINTISELLLFTTHQLVWSITPDNATDKSVEFFSSNEAVATVNAKGLITAHANGTVTITVKVYGNRKLDVVFDIVVYTPDYIDGAYKTNSYVGVNEVIELNADIVRKDGSGESVAWKSLNPEIATVDIDGNVRGVAKGLATIVAYDPSNPELQLEFVVTVLDGETSELLQLVLKNHESNVFTRYNLNIGNTYNKDILGSVSKLLFNYDYQIDDSRKDTEVEKNTGDYYLDMTSVEFITVHYTGNMAAGADAKANANYFVGDNAVSIHFTTGNDGIYQCLDLKDGGYHAGDSGAYNVVGAFKWIPSGVKVGENDPMYPEFTISNDFYYEINGHKTTIPMPKPWNYESRGTDHILNSDGTISSNSAFKQSGFTNRTPESFINDQGLPFTIVDGEYYMGTTWWAYTQVYEGRICSTGGNRNSIGIESCVNEGSDLWYTWQITAQLVARLMYDQELDITRVRGHHFFTAKDCPQPMLENDLEIWWEFLELVEAEHEVYTDYRDAQISFESHNSDIVNSNGRVVKQPNETTCATYTITITKDGKTETITLGSMVKGLYVDR